MQLIEYIRRTHLLKGKRKMKKDLIALLNELNRWANPGDGKEGDIIYLHSIGHELNPDDPDNEDGMTLGDAITLLHKKYAKKKS